MDNTIGFLVSITSSQGIPPGCYSLQVSYMNSIKDLGHMKKNRSVHMGAFFSLDSSQRMTVGFKMMEVFLFRSNHKHWKILPFGSCQISADSIAQNKLCNSQSISVSITDPVFSSVSCRIMVRIQPVFRESIYSLPKEESIVHQPVAVELTISRCEIHNTEWNSKYYCRFVLPNRNAFSTPAILGVTPVWNTTILSSELSVQDTVTAECELYRQTPSFDKFIGSSPFSYTRPKDDDGSECNIVVPIKNDVAFIHFTVRTIYCCTDCKQKEVSSSTEPPLSPDTLSQENRSRLSETTNRRRSSISTPLRFVKNNKNAQAGDRTQDLRVISTTL